MNILSPALRKLAMCLFLLGGTILLMGASTGDEAQAPTPPESFPSKVVWTPDGKHIIFSRGFEGIFMVDVAGSELRAIPADAPLGTRSSPGNALPALSPDSRQLAYVAPLGGESAAIMVSDLDGSGARRLTQDEKFNTHPVWSPDGERIAYLADGKLTVMRADGANARMLAPSVEAVSAAPVWSPGGTQIAFVGIRDNSKYPYAIYIARTYESGWFGLGATVSVPSWSPTSGLAYLMPEDSGEVSLVTRQRTGADPQKVWTFVQVDRWNDNLLWSPDGSAILFTTAGTVVVVSIDNVEERILARAAGVRAAWSPDGARFAVLTGRHREEEAGNSEHEALYTKMRDGRFRRVLVKVTNERLAANYPGWYDVSRNIAACGHGYVVSDPTAQVFAVPMPFEHSGLVEDCEILMAIRDRLAGDFLLNWNAETPITEWWGVGILPRYYGFNLNRVEALWFPFVHYTANRSVFDLFFSMHADLIFRGTSSSYYPSLPEQGTGYNGLNGSIPPELGSLPHLAYLNLGGNGLTGSIPPELGISSLRFLDLSNNDLTGRIPPELGNTSVWHLDLSGNDLRGKIPPELGRIVSYTLETGGRSYDLSLNLLNLANNDLSGSIPGELSYQDGLRWLDLRNNNLTGSIPPELDKLTILMELHLQGNDLTGCVPAALSDQLTVLKTDGLEYCAE